MRCKECSICIAHSGKKTKETRLCSICRGIRKKFRRPVHDQRCKIISKFQSLHPLDQAIVEDYNRENGK